MDSKSFSQREGKSQEKGLVNEVSVYVRVSTQEQTHEQQSEACRKFCEYKGFKIGEIYSDVGSGKNWKDRPAFKKLLNDLRLYKYHAVVVFRLDRLFRNVVEAVNIFQEWDSKGIEIYSLNEGLDTSTPIGQAMRTIILTLAQLERENISQATRERMWALRDMGKKLGRPGITDFQRERIRELRERGLSYSQIAGHMRIKKSTVAKYSKLSINGGVSKSGGTKGSVKGGV